MASRLQGRHFKFSYLINLYPPPHPHPLPFYCVTTAIVADAMPRNWLSPPGMKCAHYTPSESESPGRRAGRGPAGPVGTAPGRSYT